MLPEINENKELLNLLVRAAELIEEVYARHPELIHDDHAQDYSDIVQAIQNNNVYFKGNPKILQMSHDFNPLKAFGKMPMEKAGKIKGQKEKRNAV